jgi:RecA-family ATPase
VAHRYITAAANMEAKDVVANKAKAMAAYDKIRDNVKFKDATDRDMSWVESVCKTYKPDIVVLDMGDKFAKTGGYSRTDEALKANAIYARQIAKQHGCAMFYMSQLSAEAENKVVLNQSMMEGSRTGKAAEADLMLLIAKNPPVEGAEEEDTMRHLNVVKNKLSGWHGIVHTNLNYRTARYEA